VCITAVCKSHEFLLKVRRLSSFFRRQRLHLHVDASYFFPRRCKGFDFDNESMFFSMMSNTSGYTTKSVMHGHYDYRPTVTILPLKHHCPSTSTKLCCSVTEAYKCDGLLRAILGTVVAETWNPQLPDHKSNALPPGNQICKTRFVCKHAQLDACQKCRLHNTQRYTQNCGLFPQQHW